MRPIFRLEDGTLVREPAADFAAFVAAQQELARSRFGPDRSRRATHSVLWRLLTPARARRPPAAASSGSERLPSEDAIRAVNARILEELGRQVRDAGARLVLVDVARYLRPGAEATSDLLDRLAREQGFGYVDLSPPLLRAEQRGEATRWLHDRHWNERGNEIFAAALARWIERDTAR